MIIFAFLMQYSRIENSVFVSGSSFQSQVAVKFLEQISTGQKVSILLLFAFFWDSTRFNIAEILAINSFGENGFAT